MLSPPGCEAAAASVAGAVAAGSGAQAVDVDTLLDRELERETEIGIVMHNMLAKGQIVPVSITLQLLKNACVYGNNAVGTH